jgi:hypothetical protein
MLGLVVIIFTSGCASVSESDVFNVSVSTDKDVYHSGEFMAMNLNITGAQKYENLTLIVAGVKDSRGNFRINYENNMSFNESFSSFNITFQMPSCYGCAGVSPGEYVVNLQMIHEGNVIGSYNKTIRLEK